MPSNTMISALATNKDNCSIHVRVGRVWEAINKKTNLLLHTNVILLDEEVWFTKTLLQIRHLIYLNILHTTISLLYTSIF